MDQKNWLWRKKSFEKKLISNDKADPSVKDNGEEVQILENEKEKILEESVKSLNEKLASALDECNAKQELVTKFTKMAEEATADHKKAESEIMHLKEELEEAIEQREAANGRLIHINSALKDCMQKLTFTREEMEQRVRDAVMRTSEEFKKSHNMLEDKLAEMNKKVTNLTIENSHLSKVLLVKGKIIEDLAESNSHAEALMSRLDSAEKENAFLRYEFRMLESEFHSRNEEMEFIRRSADTSHKQQLENVKKIKRLEAECQRLRVMVRKRMPGQSQAVLTKMKKEIELEERNQSQTRKTTNPTLVVKDTHLGNNDPDILRKEVSFLVESLCNVEEENKNLKLVLSQKEHESVALISEPEHFKNHKDHLGVSEMRLMDDFVEMEKLAIVAVDAPLGTSQASPELNLTLSDSSIRNEHENHVDSTGRELVQVKQGDLSDLDQEKGVDLISGNSRDWIEHVLKVISEESSISKRDFYELVEEVRAAWHNLNFGGKKSESSMQPISGYIAWRSPVTSPKADSDISFPVIDSSVEQRSDEYTSVSSISIRDEFIKHFGPSGLGTATDSRALQNFMSEMEKIHSVIQAENESLRTEVETLKESNRMMEDMIENQKSINEDLDTQLSVTKAKLNESFQKMSSLEVELEDKSHCFEDLEGMCLELQLQLESINSTKIPDENMEKELQIQQTGWEITAASVKLAECQETILNLGKQIKALTLLEEEPVVDTQLSPSASNNKTLKHHVSLLDQMLFEDGTKKETLKSPMKKDAVNIPNSCNAICTFKGTPSGPYSGLSNGSKNAKVGAVVILSGRKHGGGRGFGFLRKLLLRKKKGSSKRTSYSLAV